MGATLPMSGGLGSGGVCYTDPIAGPIPRTAFTRAAWRLAHRLRTLVGWRRGFKVERYYYKETTTEPLTRALSRRGSGSKELRVTFPDGTKLLIHCTSRRAYADVMGPMLLAQFQRTAGMIRPGMRVVTTPCGTGHTAKWLSERVGPSGAVVALDSDVESIAYAQKRYPLANVAFEAGGPSALTGEVNGSFNAGFCVTTDPEVLTPELLAEVWRVVAPEGWMMVGCAGEGARGRVEKVLPRGGEIVVDWLTSMEEGYQMAMVRKGG